METLRSRACWTKPYILAINFRLAPPRLPCYKLGLKFGRDDILKRFLQSRLTGFYFKVFKDGKVAAEDPISLLHRDEHQAKVADITPLDHQDRHNLDLLRRAMAVEALPEEWRDYFQERLVQLTGSP